MENNPAGPAPAVPNFRQISVASTLAEIALTDVLKKPGDFCSYAHLKERLNLNPQEEGRGYVATARRRFEDKNNCVLAVVPNEGIKWELQMEVVTDQWGRDSGHGRRHARRMLKRQQTTIGKEGDLTPELVRERNQHLAFAGALFYMYRPRTERVIATIADQSGKILTAAEALDHFKKGTP